MISAENRKKAADIVRQMTNQQKARLLVGQDFWHINGVEEFDLPAVMVTDGPHGLRKQIGAADHVGMNNSVPAVCFPTASATACSFDPELLREVGEALGEECIQEEVAVLLGPGVNHKRSPLCGRNFEYFSEDPYLTRKLAAAMVNGLQSKGIGASVKHFAGNNQEQYRLVADSVIDERALREIYLRQFEAVVKEGQPATIMAAYNRLNGTYCCENEALLEDTARKKWGFEGLFVSDWGALNDPVDSFKNGLDLEMPGVTKGSDELVLEVLERGEFPQEKLDAAARRLVALLLHHESIRPAPYDQAAHLSLARRAAAESAVLLKNSGVLPIRATASLAVIGLFAKHPRYQGAGSSKVNPIALDNACEALAERGITFTYADGYDANGNTTEELLSRAREAAAGKEAVIVFAGLPDSYESEGYDREDLELPDGHNRLIAEMAKVNPNTVVVLQCGSCVTMPWANDVNSILLTYLSGCQGGKAVVDLLTGAVNPSGKLAETFPVALEDTPCFDYYRKGGKVCQYRESIFTGYRYYDTAKKPVLFPFGHGLSYTQFAYNDLWVRQENGNISVSFSVRNIGKCAGKEAVQLYVSHKDSTIFKAEQELRRFAKISLAPGEERRVSFVLMTDDIAYYNTEIHDWHTESGVYEIRVGSSSRDIRLRETVRIAGNDAIQPPDYRQTAPAYYQPEQLAHIPQEQFEALLGRPVPTDEKAHWPYTRNVTLGELREDEKAFAALRPLLSRRAAIEESMDEDAIRQREVAERESPIRNIAMTGASKQDIAALVKRINQREE